MKKITTLLLFLFVMLAFVNASTATTQTAITKNEAAVITENTSATVDTATAT